MRERACLLCGWYFYGADTCRNLKCRGYAVESRVWTAERLLAVTKWWVAQLGLDRNEYAVSYLVDQTGEAFGETGWDACVSFDHAYLRVQVQFNLPMWKEASNESGQESILHELAHIILCDFPAPVGDDKPEDRDTSDAEERCCQRVARAMLKAKGLCPL